MNTTIKRLLLLSIEVVALSGFVLANHGGNHYSRFTATCSGQGKVYVHMSTNNVPDISNIPDGDWKSSSDSKTFTCSDSNGEDDKQKFYAFAKANDGYVFTGWSDSSTNEESNSSTDNPLEKELKATSKDSSNPSPDDTYYAHFYPYFKFSATAITCNAVMGTANISSNPSESVISATKNNSPATTTTATFTASSNEGYIFRGWGTTSDATEFESNLIEYETTISSEGSEPGSVTNKTLYAIFCKYSADVSSISFGDVVYMSSSQTRTFHITAQNVGAWGTSGLDGEKLSVSLSGNTDDNTLQTCTITVTLDPTAGSGEISQTLRITTSRGGNIDIPVTANVSATPTYSWNTDIWNADGSQKRTISVGDDDLSSIVSSSSGATPVYTITSFVASGSNNSDAPALSFTDNTLKCSQAGTYMLQISQEAEENGYNAGSSTHTLVISKRLNTILVNDKNDYSTCLNYASSQAITITSDNELSNPIVEPNNEYLVNGADYTSATVLTGSISTTFNGGIAKWNVTQEENYKYLAGSATITATVSALNETCYLVNDGNEHLLNNTTPIYEWSDVPDVVGAFSFEAKKNDNTSQGSVTIHKKVNNNWSEVATKSAGWGSGDPIKTSYNTFTDVVLSANSKGVKFTQSNNNKYIKNVKVTRLLFLTPSASSINFGNTLENAPLTESFSLDWSCSQNDGNITLVSDDTHFTLSTDNETFSASVTIANASQTTGRSGRTTIYVKYVSAATGDHSGHITIYNKSRKSTVNLSGTTQGKYDLVITGANIPANTLYVGEEMASGISFAFEGSDVTVGTPTEGEGSSHFYYVLTNNTVADDATWPNNEYSNKVVEYDAANNKFVAYNAGTATISFYEAGNSSINARDPQAYTITVSKVAPEFTQKLSSVAVNNNVTLGNFASSTSDGMLSWSLPSNSYASMVNNEIVTHSEGTVTVTVSVATTYMYAAAETNMNLDITAVSGAEWLEKPTPTSGSYYLFNVGANQFIKMNNGFPATTETITDATLFTITGTSATDIAYTKSETTYYLYQSAGTYSENTTSVVSMGESFAWNITSYNTSYYQIHSNHKWGKNWAWESDSHISDTERYITANGGNANCSCSKESKEYNTANGSWIFVTEGEYAAFQAYLTAVELLGDENHLSESLKGDLATAVATKTKGSDNYATWTSSLTTLTARCSTYVANLETPETLHRDKNDNGYYMFYNASNNARLGDDVQAYTASWSGNDLVLTAVPNQVIPAGTVALMFSNTQENFYYAFEAATSAISGNAFVHHDPTTYNSMEHTDYILTAIRNTDNNSVIDCYAFCKYVGNNHDELLANRNVLVWTAPAQCAPDLIRIVTEDNTATALVPVYEGNSQSKQINDGRIYTILGIPVADMSAPGIYIRNGQKYVVR